MAGDIFFTDARIWSSNSIGFDDMMARAIKRCRDDETLLVTMFHHAEEVRCLDINLCDDRNLQAALAERILEAARDSLHELRANPMSRPETIRSREELVDLAQVHLAELAGKTKDLP